MLRILLAAQTGTDDGLLLPEDGGSAVVWVFFLGVVIGLYVLISRTRDRAEREFWERKRRERDEQNDSQDPGE